MSLKLTPDTVAVLRNFSGINQSLLFRTDKVLNTIAESKSVMARVEIVEEFDREFAIYDLSEFLGTLSLFSDPELELTEKCVVLKDAPPAKAKGKYFYADASMIAEFPPLDKIQKALAKPEIEFDWTEENLAQLMKAAGALQSPNLSVESDGKKVYITAFNEKIDAANTYSLEVGKGNGKKFKMIYKTENLKLMKGGYSVKISAQKISEFKHNSIGLTYWVALEDSSKYE